MNKASVTKEQNERNRKILDGLLKLPENRYCVDCNSRGPRWASVNLGVFLCIQCSGIHRSLGVHISQVRSATLDTWLPDQVAFMQRMGNQKANEYWEADLPSNFRRPSEDNRAAVEGFIRNKYERKMYAMRNVSPPRLDKPDRPRPAPKADDTNSPRENGGYSSDGGIRYSDDPQARGAPSRFGGPPQHASPAPRPTPPTTPPPRVATQVTAAQARPTSPPAQPPHKVESAPAFFDLLSISDNAPPAQPPQAAPPAAVSTPQVDNSWAAFPEPVATPASPQAPPAPIAAAPPAGTMAALTDLFTVSTPESAPAAAQTAPPASGGAPAAAAAQHHAQPKKNTSDILSLFDQGPSPAMLQQQMLFMQQQQALYMQAAQAGAVAPGGALPNMFAGAAPMAGLGAADATAMQGGGFAGVSAGGFGAMPMPVPGGQLPMQGAGMFGQPMPGFSNPYGQPPAVQGFQGGAPLHMGSPGPVGPVGGPAPPSGAATNPGAHYDFSALLQSAK